MHSHFLFQSSEWLGDGEIAFSTSPTTLRFRVKWTISVLPDGSSACEQAVEIIGGDRIENYFTIEHTDTDAFSIDLKNEAIGSASGTGLLKGETVAWELRNAPILDGYEVYERISLSEYSMRAEYLADDLSRTQISGRIWRKVGTV